MENDQDEDMMLDPSSVGQAETTTTITAETAPRRVMISDTPRTSPTAINIPNATRRFDIENGIHRPTTVPANAPITATNTHRGAPRTNTFTRCLKRVRNVVSSSSIFSPKTTTPSYSIGSKNNGKARKKAQDVTAGASAEPRTVSATSYRLAHSRTSTSPSQQPQGDGAVISRKRQSRSSPSPVKALFGRSSRQWTGQNVADVPADTGETYPFTLDPEAPTLPDVQQNHDIDPTRPRSFLPAHVPLVPQDSATFPTDMTTPASHHERHRSSPTRVHYHCHQCTFIMAADGICNICGHQKCSLCTRKANPHGGAKWYRDAQATSTANLLPKHPAAYGYQGCEGNVVAQQDYVYRSDSPTTADIPNLLARLTSPFRRRTPTPTSTSINASSQAADIPASQPLEHTYHNEKSSPHESQNQTLLPHDQQQQHAQAQPRQGRVFRKVRYRIKYTCDRCGKQFDESTKRCLSCGHGKCGMCGRWPPRDFMQEMRRRPMESLESRLAGVALEEARVPNVLDEKNDVMGTGEQRDNNEMPRP